jgi:hypothetical protein
MSKTPDLAEVFTSFVRGKTDPFFEIIDPVVEKTLVKSPHYRFFILIHETSLSE